MTYQIARKGWKKDNPDGRDLTYQAPHVVLPSMVDLEDQFPEVFDQEREGSCTAQAIAGLVVYDQLQQGLPVVTPSRNFLYYFERLAEHTVNSDAGASLRDGMKVLAKIGAPPETFWPYLESNLFTRPIQQA